MEHWAETAEIKDAARGVRRRQDKRAAEEQLEGEADDSDGPVPPP
jgi:hypothetical protein